VLATVAEQPNIFEPGPWERELGGARGTRLAAAAGASELGCSLYELDPGAQAAPYHAHHANEELVLVLDGEIELRSPEGTRRLSRGAVAAFPRGAEGAHRLRNVGEEPARYLMFSTMRFPELAEQLDTGTVLAMRGPADGWAFPVGSDGDYVELTLQALDAERAGEDR
jgi:uncharacterized cupin superfamily protein